MNLSSSSNSIVLFLLFIEISFSLKNLSILSELFEFWLFLLLSTFWELVSSCLLFTLFTLFTFIIFFIFWSFFGWSCLIGSLVSTLISISFWLFILFISSGEYFSLSYNNIICELLLFDEFISSFLSFDSLFFVLLIWSSLFSFFSFWMLFIVIEFFFEISLFELLIFSSFSW